MSTADLLAFDKASTKRRIDAQGFLHVEDCNISKAVVNSYSGKEIPDFVSLGLDPNKVYKIYRDPKELAKAADSFNNLPLMDKHIEVSDLDLENPKVKDHLVGSTGTDAKFKAPYLVNSLVVYTRGAIDGVESKDQSELSCAYRYKIDMTPGTVDGENYDGRMTNIAGNHVAIVVEGRAGADVMVADSAEQIKLENRRAMCVKLKQAFDENPEGVNQYSGASAGKASAKAIKSGGKEDHFNAGEQHLEAGKQANKEGRHADAMYHMKMATGHFKAAQGRSIKFGRNFGDLPKMSKAHDSASQVNPYIDQLTKLKAEINEKLKAKVNETNREVLDDCTSALDLAVHHLLDFEEAGDMTGDSLSVKLRRALGYAQDTIVHVPGHKDSKGKAAPWAVKSESTGKVISSSPTKEGAVSNLRNIEGHKANDVAKREDVSPKSGITKYGEVAYADKKNKRYPIDTEAHVRAALSYWGQAKNRNEYSKEDQQTITSNIESAKKKFKIGENEHRK